MNVNSAPEDNLLCSSRWNALQRQEPLRVWTSPGAHEMGRALPSMLSLQKFGLLLQIKRRLTAAYNPQIYDPCLILDKAPKA